MSILRSVLTMLARPAVFSSLGIAILLAVIWFGGGMLGSHLQMSSQFPFDGLSRFLLCLLVGAIAGGFLFLRRVLAQRKSKQIEQRLQAQAQDQLQSTRPDRQVEISELEGQFENALERLKGSKLGRGALYALPWYVIIGPPGSGKTKMLTESGLNFVSNAEDGRGIRGIGGTRNCDWWFADEGILLDTAGRYTTRSDDHEEWIAFLEMLKKARRRAPINGVVVCISVAERKVDGSLSGLLHMSEDELAEHAKNIRNRLDELMERLEMTFPVYLVFTKCDLLGGFVETFGSMNREERAQMWGVSHEYSESDREELHKVFEADFEELYRRLAHRRLEQLSRDRPQRKAQRVYSFPLQFALARNRLSLFVEQLTRKHSMNEQPRFRGWFFTSGTQEGEPFDRVLTEIGSAVGLHGPASADAEDDNAQKKSYFIDDLLQDLVFRDRQLAKSSVAAERRRRVAKFALTIGAGVVGLLLCFYLVGRYWSSSTRIDEVGALIGELRSGGETLSASELDRLVGKMRELESQGREQLTDFPLGYREHLFRSLRTRYGRALKSQFLDPLRAQLRQRVHFDAVQSRLAAFQEKKKSDGIELASPILVELRGVLDCLDELYQNPGTPEKLRSGITRKGILGKWGGSDLSEEQRREHLDNWIHYFVEGDGARLRKDYRYSEVSGRIADAREQIEISLGGDPGESTKIKILEGGGSEDVVIDRTKSKEELVEEHRKRRPDLPDEEVAKQADEEIRATVHGNLQAPNRSLSGAKSFTLAQRFTADLYANYWQKLGDQYSRYLATLHSEPSQVSTRLEGLRGYFTKGKELYAEKNEAFRKLVNNDIAAAFALFSDDLPRKSRVEKIRTFYLELEAAKKKLREDYEKEKVEAHDEDLARLLRDTLLATFDYAREGIEATVLDELREHWRKKLATDLESFKKLYPFAPKASASVQASAFNSFFAPTKGLFDQTQREIDEVRLVTVIPPATTGGLELPEEMRDARRHVKRLQDVWFEGGSEEASVAFHLMLQREGETKGWTFELGNTEISGLTGLRQQIRAERRWVLGTPTKLRVEVRTGTKKLIVGEPKDDWSLFRFLQQGDAVAVDQGSRYLEAFGSHGAGVLYELKWHASEERDPGKWVRLFFRSKGEGRNDVFEPTFWPTDQLYSGAEN